MIFLIFGILLIPLLTSHTPLFVTTMILIAEIVAMFVLTLTKGFSGNYVPFLLICLIVNISVGIIYYTKNKS
jgi:hypothetical protein